MFLKKICLKCFSLCLQFGCCEALCLLALNFPVCTWSTGWHCGYISSSSNFSSRSSLNRSRGRTLRCVYYVLCELILYLDTWCHPRCIICHRISCQTLSVVALHLNSSLSWDTHPSSSVLVPLICSMSQPSSTAASSTTSSSAPDTERRTLTVGMANMVLSLLSSAWFPLDLSAHQDALLLSGNLLAGG